MQKNVEMVTRIADAADANTEAIKSQAITMNGQITAIEAQNDTMRESAAATKKIATATQDSVEAVMSKDRARIKIMVQPAKVVSGPQMIACWLENYGPTTGFIKEFRARLLRISERDIVPDYDKCRLMLFNESILGNAKMGRVRCVIMEPDDPLTEDDVMSLRTEKSFIHFYGFATYRDVFERDRKVTIHIRWFMRWGGTFKGMIMEYWDPVGLPEENADK